MTQQMLFEMQRPCFNCPFSKRPHAIRGLGKERATEISESIAAGATFPCHKTTFEDENGARIIHPNEQMCAGAMIVCEKTQGPNQAMILARMLGWWGGRVDTKSPVVDSWDEFIEVQTEEAEQCPKSSSMCRPRAK
ncbi:MAG: hypothetical protein IT428_16170 [Planctomycetaceae bacterium]|nr:hypothetical protein [Planctomycetaceae bacterium]